MTEARVMTRVGSVLGLGPGATVRARVRLTVMVRARVVTRVGSVFRLGPGATVRARVRARVKAMVEVAIECRV